MMSSIVPETMTKEVLKKSLAANGLPDWGSRQEMYDRLMSSGEKKKPGPKPKVPDAKKAKTSPMIDQAELAFYASERKHLVAQGITGTAAQNAELKRRYALVKQSKVKPSPKQTSPPKQMSGTPIKLPTLLSAGQLATANLTLQGVENGAAGEIMYVYAHNAPVSATPSSAEAKKIAKRSAPESDEEDEEDDDEEEDEDMAACESVVVMCLMKHDKEWLSAGCVAHGESGSGSKKTLAERLAEQLCNETDHDDDDE
eukprot:3147501-Prymnesium_polylepis.2